MEPKDVYSQVNENWRFLAKWRQIAFTGQLAVLAGALSFTNAAVDHSLSPLVVVLCFLLVVLLSIVLWIADKRTHTLTMHACRAGVGLEGDLKGFFRVNKELDYSAEVGHGINLDPGAEADQIKGHRVRAKVGRWLRRWLRYWWHRESHSKAVDLLCFGSAALFAVLAGLILSGRFQSTDGTRDSWDYVVIHGPIVASPTSGSVSLAQQLTRASGDGWEFVATGTDDTSGPFVIVRRHKK